MRCGLILLLALPAQALAYGEPAEDGVPNNEERLLHVLTNQVRQDPHAWMGWDTSLATGEARGPLFMQDGLEEAARFHANDMSAHGCFQHDSCDGTPVGTRLARFFAGPAGENILMGFSVRATESITLWMNSTGHRTNILDGRYNRLGAGFASAGSNNYYVQDFGIEDANAKQAIPAAAFERLDSGKIRLLANHFDANGFAPTSFKAVLGFKEITLEKIAGRDGNATYQALADEPADCTPLYFVSGSTTFPTTGALLAGSTCTKSFQAEDPARSDSRPVIDANDDQGGCRCVATRESAWTFAPLALLFFALVFLKKIE